ncbi:hypothetical protein ACFT2C_04780 [Promicromonospora sp. NPDC057138]|uniref:hypothetical protein n=1 Tax=Promicromonospora sp. NPDC057138 TaxID=3346031 RepID=UPI0036443EEE
MSTAFPDDRSFPLGHPAVQADMWAMHDHTHTSAAAAHALLAEHVWVALRALGVTGGRMLLRGVDPEVLAGVPADERSGPPVRDGRLQADIPRPGWPHTRLRLVRFEPGYVPGRFDVVFLNASFSDVVHHDGKLRHARWQEHNQDLLSSLAHTAPGGLVAALVSADVMDAADPGPRRGITLLADLLGAARLPGGALRNVPGCDSPVDLLLLRRRPDDQPAGGARFEASVQLPLDGVPVHLNEYFHDRIGDVLGRPVLRPMPSGPPRLTVEPDMIPLAQDLRTTLAEIVRNAAAHGLTARPSTPPSAGTGAPGDDPGAPPHAPEAGPGDAPGADLSRPPCAGQARPTHGPLSPPPVGQDEPRPQL